MDNVNQITAECFNALRQLRELDGADPSPELIHERLRGFIEAMRERAREQGMPQRDADDIAYAIVALADEIALGKAEPMRGFWMERPLQLQYFNEYARGRRLLHAPAARSGAIAARPTCCASTTSACCSASRASTACAAASSS